MRNKFIILLFAGVIFAGAISTVDAASNYWRYRYPNTYFSSGRVGIGTAYPTRMLDVQGDVEFGRWGGSRLVISTPISGIRLNSENKNIIIPSGKVGIGTNNPTKKLTVNGTIRAKEIIVDTGWADHVFEDDYNLLSLEQIKQFIDHNGHLPGIPSKSKIEAEGASLGETSTLLLEKIEELTLHLIDLNEQVQTLKY